MKIIHLFFFLSFNCVFSQVDNFDKFYKSLNENEKEIFVKINKVKSLKTPENFKIYLDSVTGNIEKTSNLYKLLLPFVVINHEEMRNYNEAIEGYNQLIKFFPEEEYDYLVRLSILYKYVDNFDKSIEILKRQIELDSNEPLAYSNLANTYLILNRYEEAFEVLESNKNEYKLDDDFKHYASIYFYRNDFNKAKTEIDKYLLSEFSKEDFKALLLASKIYSKLNKKNQSCSFINEADKICPNLAGIENEIKTILISNLIKDRNEIDLILKTCQ